MLTKLKKKFVLMKYAISEHNNYPDVVKILYTSIWSENADAYW